MYTLCNVLKGGEMKHHSNTRKPLLTDDSKISQLKQALSHVDEASFRFDSMLVIVHLDETWFYLYEETGTFYLGKNEPLPERSAKQKRILPKVMFLCAVVRPRFGLWTFTKLVPAQRWSRNRPARTLELKNMNVTRDMHNKFLLEKMKPEVFEKWPGLRSIKVKLLKDNARAHVPVDDVDIVPAGRRNRSEITWMAQPPNQPDFNFLDLGCFRHIQSLSYKTPANTIQELVDATNAAYDAFLPRKLDGNLICLQKCLESSMKKNGVNKQNLPHLHKQRRRNEGNNIENVVCDRAVYNLANKILLEPE